MTLPSTNSLPAAQIPGADVALTQPFVDWLRLVAPYIHAFRGKVFVVGFVGELVQAGRLSRLAHDLSLLHAMGMKIVMVYGSRPQVEEQLALRQITGVFHNGIRVTDSAALECAKEAAGEIRLDIEAAFSQGLPNTPMAHAAVRVVSGNFVTARPMGILDGVDLQHTGLVRKVEVESIRQALDGNAMVLLSPLGFSPTGEAFNLTMEDVATSAAIALKADKLIFVTEVDGVLSDAGELIEELQADVAQNMINSGTLSTNVSDYLGYTLKATANGVARGHIVPYDLDGSVLLELFSHEGVGTMLAQDNLESLREANFDDAGNIKSLIEPLEQEGTLVRRGRDRIERDIDKFTVLEHDNILWGCAALYAYPAEQVGELACLVVHPSWQSFGDGERLLKRIEQRARAAGLKKLFVLTTRTSHWFIKRGFQIGDINALPKDRQRIYDWGRKSQVLIKTL